MDGFSVCSKIRENSNAHILIASSKTEKADKLKGLYTGADDYIEKPYDMMPGSKGDLFSPLKI